MKKSVNLFLLLFVLLVFNVKTNFAQLASQNEIKLEVISSGIALIGANSSNTIAGPYFGGIFAYGVGEGLTIFAESGYGWTKFDKADNLKLVETPVTAGLTYNFGKLLNQSLIEPYAGLSTGALTLLLQSDGNTIQQNGYEQKSTTLSVEGILGVNFQIHPAFSVNILGKYSHGFSKEGDPGLDSQEFNSINIGGGISYAFSVLQ